MPDLIDHRTIPPQMLLHWADRNAVTTARMGDHLIIREVCARCDDRFHLYLSRGLRTHISDDHVRRKLAHDRGVVFKQRYPDDVEVAYCPTCADALARILTRFERGLRGDERHVSIKLADYDHLMTFFRPGWWCAIPPERRRYATSVAIADKTGAPAWGYPPVIFPI